MFGNVNVERDFDTDMVRVWHMVQELSEQLAHNHKIVGTLQSQAAVLKVWYLFARPMTIAYFSFRSALLTMALAINYDDSTLTFHKVRESPLTQSLARSSYHSL